MSELLERTDPTIQSDGVLVNHVGFMPDSPKYCVVSRPPEKQFTIHRLKDCVWTQVLEGRLADGGPDLEPGWVGEFTSLRDDLVMLSMAWVRLGHDQLDRSPSSRKRLIKSGRRRTQLKAL